MGLSQLQDHRMLETSHPLLLRCALGNPPVLGQRYYEHPRMPLDDVSFGRLGAQPPFSTTAFQGQFEEVVRHARNSSPCLGLPSGEYAINFAGLTAVAIAAA